MGKNVASPRKGAGGQGRGQQHMITASLVKRMQREGIRCYPEKPAVRLEGTQIEKRLKCVKG